MLETYLAVTAALGTYGLLSALNDLIMRRKRDAALDELMAKFQDSFKAEEEPKEKP